MQIFPEDIAVFLSVSGIFGTKEEPGSMRYDYQQWLESAIEEKIAREAKHSEKEESAK